jgi:hypothetical protein
MRRRAGCRGPAVQLLRRFECWRSLGPVARDSHPVAREKCRDAAVLAAAAAGLRWGRLRLAHSSIWRVH